MTENAFTRRFYSPKQDPEESVEPVVDPEAPLDPPVEESVEDVGKGEED